MKKIFITGAGGFVGQHLINILRNHYFIIGLIHQKVPHDTKKDFIKYHKGNILNNDNFFGLIKKYQPEIIIHLAAKTTTWFNQPEDIFKVNLFGSINLYENVAKLKILNGYNPQIIYISSSEIYGKSLIPGNI